MFLTSFSAPVQGICVWRTSRRNAFIQHKNTRSPEVTKHQKFHTDDDSIETVMSDELARSSVRCSSGTKLFPLLPQHSAYSQTSQQTVTWNRKTGSLFPTQRPRCGHFLSSCYLTETSLD